VVKKECGEVSTRGVIIPRVEKFTYLESIIKEREDIDDKINQRIRVGGKNKRMILGYYVTRRFL